MNPSTKGWLKAFLEERVASVIKSDKKEDLNKGQNPDQSFYGIIQPTGIMYGYPINLLDLKGEAHWSPKDKLKVLMVDCAFNINLLYNMNKVAEKDYLATLVTGIVNFYNGVYNEIYTGSQGWLRRNKDAFEQAEDILEKRVSSIELSVGNNFWSSFFGYSQLFLDMYIFSKWNITQPNQALVEYFREQKESLSLNSIKVIAAASFADQKIETPERKLLEYFVSSTNLRPEQKKEAQLIFENGILLDDIDINASDPWVLRKFFVELAILTIWSDKKVGALERKFLLDFCTSLSFSEEEFENSMIAVEGFVLQYWAQLDKLQDKIDYQEVSEEYISRLGKVLGRNKDRIINDIKKDSALMDLLKQGQTRELDHGQKEMARVRLFSVLKHIPNFRVIALPVNFLDYKTLIRLFPKDIFANVLNDE